jgi:hypothetical protein
VGFCIGLTVAINAFIHQLVPAHEIPLFFQGVSALMDGCSVACWIMGFMLAGFLLGRWRRLR